MWEYPCHVPFGLSRSSKLHVLSVFVLPLLPGVSVTVTGRCVGCGTCADDVCFVNAIRMVDGRAIIGEGCLGCGRCVEVCPTQAIKLSVADDAFVANSIERLAPLVDVT